jgi:hypothetical protein
MIFLARSGVDSRQELNNGFSMAVWLNPLETAPIAFPRSRHTEEKATKCSFADQTDSTQWDTVTTAFKTRVGRYGDL